VGPASTSLTPAQTDPAVSFTLYRRCAA